ncbi:conserved integral membrane domain protein [Mycobacterium xenopi 4042]|uniref:Conserved integral membrane domain protein n=1 Tax=Mycobacterium xenopi 4042 TaxID=1299334 RepID=X8E6N3_MYCXE|nr:conserved integral membrane domain protein [Mycobacterium xenopi 4042]
MAGPGERCRRGADALPVAVVDHHAVVHRSHPADPGAVLGLLVDTLLARLRR